MLVVVEKRFQAVEALRVVASRLLNLGNGSEREHGHGRNNDRQHSVDQVSHHGRPRTTKGPRGCGPGGRSLPYGGFSAEATPQIVTRLPKGKGPHASGPRLR